MPDFVDQPQPGCFLVRLVKGGPRVPARIFVGPPLDPETLEEMDRPPVLRATVAGERSHDPYLVWTWKREPIDESEYRWRLATLEWAMQHAPDSPEANPRRPIRLATMPPIARMR
jgi:hypothetical protein